MGIKWGTYPWFKEIGTDLIHPDDFKAFEQEANSSKVFECIDVGDYITLKYNNYYYRVRDKLFRIVPAPKYNFGEIVKIKKEDAVITDIMWHYDMRKHFYLVSVKNRKKSKRYFESDLKKKC